MTPNIRPLITDLVATLSAKSDAQSSAILQNVTNLFLEGCDSFSDDHVAVFDDVLAALIERVPDTALAALSDKLAPIGKAPPNVIAYLAQHDNIAVAQPILEKSATLTDETLAEVATKKSEKHRAAIVARGEISETVTDALLARSHAAVIGKLAAKSSAHFSPLGFVKLINHAKADKALATVIAERTDVPSELEPFLKLTLDS